MLYAAQIRKPWLVGVKVGSRLAAMISEIVIDPLKIIQLEFLTIYTHRYWWVENPIIGIRKRFLTCLS